LSREKREVLAACPGADRFSGDVHERDGANYDPAGAPKRPFMTAGDCPRRVPKACFRKGFRLFETRDTKFSTMKAPALDGACFLASNRFQRFPNRHILHRGIGQTGRPGGTLFRNLQELNSGRCGTGTGLAFLADAQAGGPQQKKKSVPEYLPTVYGQRNPLLYAMRASPSFAILVKGALQNIP